MKGKLPLVSGAGRPPPGPAETVRDPVCGMTVDPRTAAGSFAHGGHTYWFCSTGCLERFRAEPERYLTGGPVGMAHAPGDTPAAAGRHTCPMHPEVEQDGPGACPTCGMALEPATIEALPTRTEWVCPMHPEIVRSAPGSCPICGMALEPRVVTLEEPENPELLDMTRRFWIGLVLTVPVAALGMSDLIPGQPVQHALSPRLLAWIQLVLATPVVLWGGGAFFERAWASVV